MRAGWENPENHKQGYGQRHNTALGPALRNDERFVADAMGTVAQHTVVRTSGSADSTVSVYVAGTGRLIAQQSITSNDSTICTTAGDRSVDWSQPKLGPGGSTSRYYYRDDGLLVAVDHRSCVTASSCIPQGVQQPTSLTGAFEDYRYDALGRRVQVRTRMDSICEGASCNSSLMWVVWDGNEIAAEIRGVGGDGISTDSLEQGAGHGPFHGTVDYLNGPNMDEPLEVQGIVVYRTRRGLIDGGQWLSGECRTGTIDYPGATYEAYFSLIPSTQSAPTSWHGTLFAEGHDGGLMYRRNRYYDPNTGQFKQEDPLGLAGGMNAYGFGGGDPVNFADPFGLCPFCEAADAAIDFTIKYPTTARALATLVDQESAGFTCGSNPMCNNPPASGGTGWLVGRLSMVLPTAHGLGGAVAATSDAESAVSESRVFSGEKQALLDMAKSDKRSGITPADMQAYKDLNNTLPDPFPEDKVRGPETHPTRGPAARRPHGHVGPVGPHPNSRSRPMKRRRDWLQHGASKLGVRVEFDFRPTLAHVPNLTPVARLPDFGAPNGMLVFLAYDQVQSYTQQLLEAGYGFSVLGEPAINQEFDLDAFRDMLIDWGWSGDPQEKPAWLRS